ncbi:MAG: iron ABC transporter permease [Betaproteobacteria bacterium]|nr:iron ABC transporter permease [Betaproteobacteria bacterium]
MLFKRMLLWLSGLFTFAMAAPLLAVAFFGLRAWSDPSALLFTAQTVLPGYLLNSLLLCLGALFVALLLAVPSAWFTSQYRVPCAGLMQWLGILPLALPAYVVAYAYTDALDYSGWLSTWARNLFFSHTVGRQPWPEIRSLWGACFVLGVSLSPYITLILRAAFEERQQSLLEAGRSLGLSSRAAFFRVVFPVARPAVVAGGALVVMECLADYGTVSFFSVQTLSAGLFKTWFGYGDRDAAAFLALAMLLIALGLLAWERKARGRAGFASRGQTEAKRQPLLGWARLWVPLVCSIGGVLGFVIPMLLLLRAAWASQADISWPSLWAQASQTALLGVYALAIILPASAFLAYSVRLSARGTMTAVVRVASSGYAVPGLVVAIGLLSVSAVFTSVLDVILDWRFTLTTTLALVLGGYLTRFFTVGFSSLESSLGRITPNLDWAARGLGLHTGEVLFRVHLPLLRRGTMVAALLVFVDVVKELPVTLALRPLDMQTLAIGAYQFAADERLAEAAWPSLGIAVVGLMPLLLLGPRARL